MIGAALGVAGFLLGSWSGRSQPPAPAERTSQSQPSAASSEHWDEGELRTQYRSLVERCTQQTAELSLLQARLDTAGSPTPARAATYVSAPPASAIGLRNPLTERFYPARPAELAELAKSCSVRVDQPALLESTPGDVGDEAKAMRATPDEVRAMNEAMRSLHRSFREHLRALYAEALGHAPDAELSPRALLGEIRDKAPQRPSELYTRISQERAGERPVPSDLREASPYERAERMYLGMGDEFQALLTAQLGSERATALRASGGGWGWTRSIFSGCK